jgi:hypothetical protein
MIIWSGWGFLVAVIAFGMSLATEIVTERMAGDDRFYQTHAWPLSLALVFSGAIVWGVGTYLEARGGRVVIDEASGEKLTIGGEHRFFFVPVRYWGPLLMALSALPFILR